MLTVAGFVTAEVLIPQGQVQAGSIVNRLGSLDIAYRWRFAVLTDSETAATR